MTAAPRRTTARLLAAGLGAAAALWALASPAAACGGLIGENGSIQLLRTTTLAAWHDGVEHYITSFAFSGSGESVGSIIPLPGVPDDVVGGSNWTLQRLQQEVAPDVDGALSATALSEGSARGATVLLETEVDALDITVLSGGADDVGEWALDHGFFLTPDAPEMLEFYAARSPVFLAAKFNLARAAEQGLGAGDATPIHVTIPLDQPWVPLRILGLGLGADERVNADLFLLTDDRPDLLASGDGLTVERRERATDLLLDDLRSDEGMEWVPDEAWLTHLVLDDAAGELDYDLSAGTATTAPSPVAVGQSIAFFDADDPAAGDGAGLDQMVLVVTVGMGIALLGVAGVVTATAPRRRRS
jgi:hypothetical protein